MAATKKTFDKAHVLATVDSASKQSVGWYDSRLSGERQRVINYLNSALPRRTNKGSSSYVSSDVYDSVEAMKSQIVETFSANTDDLVCFPALHAQDIEAARIATEYCNHVFFADNDGPGIVNDIVHDGLTARAGIVKVYWEEDSDTTEESFSGLQYEEVQALAAQPDIAELEADQGPDGTFSGSLERKIDCSRVCVDAVAPEEFLIAPRSKSIQKAQYCGHRTQKTKAELKDEGYDPKRVDSIASGQDKELDLAPEVLARESQIESALAEDSATDPETEKVTVFESFIRMDIKDGKGVRLYKVCHAGGILLSDPEEVDRAPFKAFIPLPIPHTFYGNNFAHRVAPTQNARTVLTRGILDHTAITTNPRWTVLKGGLLNPKEMLDNRLGGIVNINRPDAVNPLQYQSLNPYVFQTIEMLKANKEESTGISALSQGLNKDAISSQNSQGLVQDLVNLSTQRQKIVARQFGKFLGEVYLEIYRLVLENADKAQKKIVQVAGNFVPVSVADWVQRNKVKVALHLGFGERDREAAKYGTLYKELSSDPALAPAFQLKNRVNLATDAMKKGGFTDYARYLTPAEQVQPPPPDPFKVAEAQAKTDTAQAALITAKSHAQKASDSAQIAFLKEQISELSAHVKALGASRDQDRKDAEVQNRIEISQREMTLAEAAAPGKETDVVAPRG